jgi:hypothetical protein
VQNFRRWLGSADRQLVEKLIAEKLAAKYVEFERRHVSPCQCPYDELELAFDSPVLAQQISKLAQCDAGKPGVARIDFIDEVRNSVKMRPH